MTPADMWREIVYASGLADLASESHDHDLLDGTGRDPNMPLDDTFAALCRDAGVTNWIGVEGILQRMRTVQGLEGLRLPDNAVDWIRRRRAEEDGGPVTGIAHHTSVRRGTYSDQWCTTAEIIGAVEDTLGKVTMDLATNPEAQALIKATRFWTDLDPCPEWPDAGPGDVVWCNPPGPCARVKEFWQAWNWCLAQRARCAFLLFNSDHWRQIDPPIRKVWCVVLRRRQHFVGAPGGASFPSTLILSWKPREIAAGLGHVVEWEP